jgi:ribose 5-phosphate isomerase B
MRIVLGADHAGFELKQDLLSYLRGLGHEVMDVGATSGTQPDDYPDFAEAVGMAVRNNRADRGVLVCGSGVGASVAANKFRRSAPVCVTTPTRRTRVSNMMT